MSDRKPTTEVDLIAIGKSDTFPALQQFVYDMIDELSATTEQQSVEPHERAWAAGGQSALRSCIARIERSIYRIENPEGEPSAELIEREAEDAARQRRRTGRYAGR